MIVHGYRAGVSSSPPTVEEFTALRADNERLSAVAEHYRELYLQMLEQCRKLELGRTGGAIDTGRCMRSSAIRLPWFEVEREQRLGRATDVREEENPSGASMSLEQTRSS